MHVMPFGRFINSVDAEHLEHVFARVDGSAVCWLAPRRTNKGRSGSAEPVHAPGSACPFPWRFLMSCEVIEVVVVGAGQAGVAMSEHLGALGIPHLVLERGRIAEQWRSGRWDSLVANGPAWHDRFPSLDVDVEPDAFASKDQVADYFEAYADK